MRSVLITGASGFCARHLARRLAQEGDARVVGLDLHRQAPPGAPLDEYLPVDVGNSQEVEAAVAHVRPERVFHLAGLVRGDAADVYRVNLMGAIHLLESVRNVVPHAGVLLVGSAAEYGIVADARMPITEERPCNPGGAYGLSKYAATLTALDYARSGLNVVVARPFNIVGAGVPESLVVGAILRRARLALAGDADPVVTVGNLDTQRDFVAVEDAVEGYIRLLEGEHFAEVFNICSGRPRSIRSVIERLLCFAPRPIRLQVDPSLVRPADVPVVYGSCEKASRACGFSPATGLDDSLQSAWEHEMEAAGR